ncbi:MAG TPA: cupredoxin domain-containing protein [Dehalococcoidia bacterium]|nr:cupredoxin domain-containing protein [Dehalococcoidia bacterium]
MRLQHRQLAAAGVIAGVTIPQLAAAAILAEPLFLVVAAVTLAAAAVAMAFDRWWAVVPVLVLPLAGIPLVAESARELHNRFDSALDFVTVLGGLGAVLAGVGYAATDLVGRLRRSHAAASRRATRVFVAGLAAFALAAAASSVATVTADRSTVSASDRAGAQVLVYDGARINIRDINARAGERVRIVVDNEDLIAHDFVIEGTAVDVYLGPKEEKLVEVMIDEAGAYKFRCTFPGHSGMSGTIYVR